MGINTAHKEDVLDADVSFPDNGQGDYSNVVVVKIIIDSREYRFTSDAVNSRSEAERVARHLDGKRIT